MIAINLDHPAIALVDEQQVIVVTHIGQVPARARYAPAAVPSRAIGRRIIVRADRRADAVLLITEGRALILIAAILAPVAAILAQLLTRFTHVTALFANIAAVTVTLGLAQLALFFAQILAAFAHFAARLGRGRSRNHQGGNQPDSEKFGLHWSILSIRQGEGTAR